MNCDICTEKFNKSSNTRVNCNSCDKSACKSCIRTFLLSSSKDAECMYCKSPHDNLFLAANLNKTWVYTIYKNHLEKVLVDREISKIPTTQEKALAIKRARQEKEVVKQLMLERKKLMNEVKLLDLQIMEKNLLIANLQNSSPGKHECNFNFKCPNTECNGFLYNYNCKLCESSVCKECMEIKEEEHECDPEKIETVKFIKKDTKPCPGCGELIHKIHGCDQMWCIKCKVAFSWKNGKIEDNIHNPEYYRWMRENEGFVPRAINNNECELIPDIQFIYNTSTTLWPKNPSTRRHSKECLSILAIHRILGHIAMVDRIFANNLNSNESKIEMLRIQYILKELDLDSWKIKLHSLDKFVKKETALIQIWRLMRDVLSKNIWYIAEQLNDFVSNTLTATEVKFNITEKSLTKIDSIRLFCNIEFERISKLYNCDSFVILKDLTERRLNDYNRELVRNKKQTRTDLQHEEVDD